MTFKESKWKTPDNITFCQMCRIISKLSSERTTLFLLTLFIVIVLYGKVVAIRLHRNQQIEPVNTPNLRSITYISDSCKRFLDFSINPFGLKGYFCEIFFIEELQNSIFQISIIHTSAFSLRTEGYCSCDITPDIYLKPIF